ncbi:MAG: S9 family peptidase [Opitutaceae bacterium]|nr:S9 family peptidase [Opitutaceae bacterium]
MLHRFLSLVLAAGFPLAGQAERLPVEIFAQPAAFNEMTLSWDGKFVAYKAEFENAERVFIRELATKEVLGVDMPSAAANLFGRIGSITWISNKRLLVSSYMGYIAIDRDGKEYALLTGGARIYGVNRVDDQYIRAGRLLHLDRDTERDQVMLEEFDPPTGRVSAGGFVGINHPNIIRIDTRTGHFTREEENPGDFIGWMLDRQGVVRVGIRIKGLKRLVMYRDDAKSPWRELKGLGEQIQDADLLGFSPDGRQLYVSKVGDSGRYALCTYDIAADKVGELILEHALYDVGATNFGGPIHTLDGRLIGVRYYTEMARTFWLDPDYAAIQQQIDLAVPQSVNRIVGISRNEEQLLVFASSAKNPGTYYLFDRKNQTLGKFIDVMPWVKPEQMAEKIPIKVKARDGLLLHGYLTVPPGREMKNLPLVVLVHGGPWSRDAYGFDPQVQFLANRGYAILQINYRGSTGYGREFYEKGFRVVGTTMQDDIEDATRFAIRKGIADPKRIAIMGASFGGYSTLMGLIRSPDLYCCGIDIAGVTDWAGIIKHGATLNPDSYAFSVDRIGDPKQDAESLKAISPLHHADKIQSPLLIVHGRDDSTVPYEQAKEMAAALDKAGKQYELMAKFNEPHGIYNFKNRIELYNRVEAFLAKHMPADL